MTADFPPATPCQKGDPDRFFIDGAGQAEVLAECGPCPKIATCLDYALHHVVDGIWGGTTKSQREKIRKRQGIVAKPLTFGRGTPGWGPSLHGTPARYRKHLRDGDKPCGVCLDGATRYKNPENNSQWQAS